jgi:hypothetical protein
MYQRALSWYLSLVHFGGSREQRPAHESGLEQNARIHDPRRVERPLDRTHRRDLRGRAAQVELAGLRPAHPVLRRDPPAVAGDALEDRMVDLRVVGVRPGDLDVDIAVGQVPEDPEDRDVAERIDDRAEFVGARRQ